MWCGKGCKCGKRLGIISFGIALGLTSGLAVFIGFMLAMYQVSSPMMAQFQIPIPNLKEAWVLSLWVLLKGFIFGFFLALFYNIFACLFALCCRQGKCHCCSGEHAHDKSEPGKV